mgnify:CR=1 FL=1
MMVFKIRGIEVKNAPFIRMLPLVIIRSLESDIRFIKNAPLVIIRSVTRGAFLTSIPHALQVGGIALR